MRILHRILLLLGVIFGFSYSLQPVYAQPLTVVLDPGHGGIDSGAVGVSGIFEKNITLQFAKILKKILQNQKEIKVFLTRNNDIYLHLNKRIEIARNLGANLFISIHADTINDAQLRGATVYTISTKASDAVAKRLSEDENKVDLLVAQPPSQSPLVSNILLDLTRKESYNNSIIFSQILLKNLETGVELITRPHRYANFQVLSAPDFPSILIELGYLSNKIDEKLISNPKWIQKTAKLIAQSIIEFAKINKMNK